jgi:hypothetical protein
MEQYFGELMKEQQVAKEIQEAELYMSEYDKLKRKLQREYGKTGKTRDIDRELKK